MMTHTTRAVQLFGQAVRETEDFDALAQLRSAAWEIFANDDEVFQEVLREIEARTAVLTQRLQQGEIFGGGNVDE